MSKHHVFVVQVWCLSCTYEELRAIGVRPAVCHGENSWPVVLQMEVLVHERPHAVDAESSCTVSFIEVPTLAHEFWDDPVEFRSFEAKTFLVRAQTPEVLDSLGHHVLPEFHDDATLGLFIDADVEVHFWVYPRHFGSRLNFLWTKDRYIYLSDAEIMI